MIHFVYKNNVVYKIHIKDSGDKKENVKLVHNSFLEFFPNEKILEVSTRSYNELGRALSAFNLSFTDINDNKISVESAYQSSKIFTDEKNVKDLYYKNSYESKIDKRLYTYGNVIRYEIFDEVFPVIPRYYFYNYLYISVLYEQNYHLFKQLIDNDFTSFTDTCSVLVNSNNQARACAYMLLLYNKNLLEHSMESTQNFYDDFVLNYKENIIDIKSENKYTEFNKLFL